MVTGLRASQDGQTTFQAHAVTWHNLPFLKQLGLTFTHGPKKLEIGNHVVILEHLIA